MDITEQQIIDHFQARDIITHGQEIDWRYLPESHDLLVKMLSHSSYRPLPENIVDFGCGYRPIGLQLPKKTENIGMRFNKVELVDPRFANIPFFDFYDGLTIPSNIKDIQVLNESVPDVLPKIASTDRTEKLGILSSLINYISRNTLQKIIQTNGLTHLGIINSASSDIDIRHPDRLSDPQELVGFLLKNNFAPCSLKITGDQIVGHFFKEV